MPNTNASALCSAVPSDPITTAREAMIASQILPGNVRHPGIIAAMSALPRERFLPPLLTASAYVDASLPLGGGRYSLEPLALARLLALAGITPEDRVLDLACGTGYSTAILAKLAKQVTGVEERQDLASQARLALEKTGARNAAIVNASPAQGYAAAAPYSLIVIAGAVADIPEPVVAQLATAGRLVCIRPVSTRPGESLAFGKAMIYGKHGNLLQGREAFDATAAILPGFEPRIRFDF